MRGAESVETVEAALRVIAHYRRSDLESRLRQTAGRLRTDRVRVLVVGEFKQGKSLLVNGLVRAPVCPVFDDVATSVPTVVRYSPEPTAALVRVVEQSDDGDPAGATLERVELPATPATRRGGATRTSGSSERCWPVVWRSSTRRASVG